MSTTTTTTAVAKKEDRNTLEEILKRPAYAERFKQVLGDKASQFCSSLVGIGRTMPDVDPKSIVGSAMVAACLDLPIEKNLGFAWIVPYKKEGKKLAQFQMGFKGYIQLALRTGYYGGMNACAVNEEAYGGRDTIGEPIILWDKIDESKPAVGYVFAFRMVNGFSKICYWTKKKVMEHAQKYSQSYRGGFDSPWKTHFDRMAIKTVIANELSDWGILSVQFQLARKSDQALVKDIDAEVEYIDTTSEVVNGQDGEAMAKNTPEATAHQKATQPKEKESQPATTVQGKVETTAEPGPKVEKSTDGKEREEDNLSLENAPKTAQDAPEEKSAVVTPPDGQSPQAEPAVNAEQAKIEPLPTIDPAFAAKPGDSDAIASVKVVASHGGITMDQLMAHLRHKRLARDDQKLVDLSEKKLVDISKHLNSWLPEIKGAK